jgi:hypothetical protein
MSVLAPWFLAGFLLIAGPIVAHLIRRATRDRLLFSSLRFLDASAPRLDRRSRIQNPWLLALRCLIVALLAFAFARPFFQQDTPPLVAPSPARHVVAVLDESASMQRTALWDAAREKITTLAATLGPADRFVLLTAGERVAELVTAAQWSATPEHERPALVRAALAARPPGWGPTPLDSAAEAALSHWEEMAEAAAGAPVRRELVLVSDFARGTRVSGFANLAWPSNVEVVLDQVTPATRGNVSLHWLGWTSPDEPTAAARLRVTRTIDTYGPLELQLRDARTGVALADPVSVDLLPGGSTIALVPLPENAPSAVTIEIAGDPEPFDNRLWLVRVPPREFALHYLGPDAANDSTQSRFYLERAVAGWRDPVTRIVTGLPPADARSSLTLIAEPLDPTLTANHRAQLEAGGFALVLVYNDDTLRTAAALAGESNWTPATPTNTDAMFGQLDFHHPLFAPFADPLYSDFTRIRFWQPHPIALPDNSAAIVVARFDDGSPAVLEIPVGQGRLIVWPGDWTPTASQWVLSSKFVPWLQALAERAAGGTARASIAEIGDATRLLSPNRPAEWRHIDRSSNNAPALPAPTTPGLYELTQGDDRREVALLVPAAESQTDPLTLETWEQLGVPLRTDTVSSSSPPLNSLSPSATAATLENRQQLWRWLLWLAVALLAIESLASFAVSRRARSAT